MLTILVVDDEKEIAESIHKTLQSAYGRQCDVQMTTVSWAAKDVLQTQVVDLLLTDIHMPGLDGIALAKIAKENNPDGKVVFLTGYQQFDYAYEAIKTGCDDFILKVNSHEELLKSIEKTMQQLQQEVADRELLQEAQRLKTLNAPKEVDEENPIDYIKQYLWDHVDKEISLNLLAGRVYLHPSYLSRLFRQSTGVTITEYMLEVRIQTAKRLLEETDLKIQEIAGRIGVDSSAYFGRIFKKALDMTPQEYRNSCYHRAEED